MIIVINQNAIVYIPPLSVIIFPPRNTFLIPVTKYANGEHCMIFNINGCSANIVKFHIIGVNQKNSCIRIANKFEKSGTNVVTADVNLVNAINILTLVYLVKNHILHLLLLLLLLKI